MPRLHRALFQTDKTLSTIWAAPTFIDVCSQIQSKQLFVFNRSNLCNFSYYDIEEFNDQTLINFLTKIVDDCLSELSRSNCIMQDEVSHWHVCFKIISTNLGWGFVPKHSVWNFGKQILFGTHYNSTLCRKFASRTWARWALAYFDGLSRVCRSASSTQWRPDQPRYEPIVAFPDWRRRWFWIVKCKDLFALPSLFFSNASSCWLLDRSTVYYWSMHSYHSGLPVFSVFIVIFLFRQFWTMRF